MNWLERALAGLKFEFKTIGGRVIELMPGTGKNYNMLKNRFKSIEMLIETKEMADKIDGPVLKH